MTDQQFLQDARKYLAMLHKRRGIVSTCVVVSMLVAVLYNYTTRPLYQATNQILIAPAAPKFLPQEVIGTGQQDYQTEYQLLQSRSLAEKVVKRLQLQKSPELQTGPLMSPWERFQRKFLGKTSVTVGSDGIPLSPAAAAVRSRLTVEPLPGGRLVNLRFTAYDPGFAAEVVNALARAYIEQSVEFRSSTSTEASDWLLERIGDQKRKMEESQKALQEFRERHHLVNVDEGRGTAADKVSTLAGAVMNARMGRIAKETLLNQVRSLPPSQLASSPAILGSGMVQSLKSKLAELQAEHARLSESLGARHPDMVRSHSEIKATEEKLQVETQNVIRSLEGECQAARAQEATLESNLEAAKRESLEATGVILDYNALKRDLDTNKQLFESLMSRSKETGLETELKSTSVRIVEKAEVPRSPILPQRTRNYQIALIVGLALGIGLSVLFEQIDNTLKTPEDVKEHLGLPFLGMVPDVDARRLAPGAPKPSPLLLRNPQASIAEAYRVLRTNLIFSSADNKGRALLVSSANPGEGKSTTVANLAESLAQNGARVLAVDADLRRPVLHHHFGIPKTPGLSELIVAKCQASEAIQSTRWKGLQVLPCGYASPNPAELLGSASMREILAALRAHYDWILIDTPPVLAMADTPVLCPLVDGVVLVVGAEVSSRTAILRAIEQIASVGGKVTGVVLNKVNLERNSYYYAQYYGEYYRSYYAEGRARQPQTPTAAGPRPLRRP